MTEITIQKNDAGQRVDRFLSKTYPNLKTALVCKLLRKKRIKLNGAKSEPNVILKEGDVLRFYLSDELLAKEPRRLEISEISAEINVIYEDENILLIDKPAGLVDLDTARGAHAGYGWISLLYLKPEYRHRGCGAQLLARAMFFYAGLGRRALRLHVAEDNADAIAFYRRWGFTQLGSENAGGSRLLLMERKLEVRRDA